MDVVIEKNTVQWFVVLAHAIILYLNNYAPNQYRLANN